MRSLIRTTCLALTWSIAWANAGCKPNSEAGADETQPSPDAPIPRFPAQGLPQSTQTGIDSSTAGSSTSATNNLTDDSANSSSNDATQEPGAQATHEPTQSSGQSSSNPSKSTQTTQETSSSSDESGDQDTTQLGPAPYVDAAYIKVATDADGNIGESIKWQSPRGENEYLRVGYRRAELFGQQVSLERRSYLIFDVSKVQRAKKASIEIFVFASSAATNFYGGYASPDPFEIVEIRSVDRHRPEQLIKAPFMQSQNHEFDVGLFDDLGDGLLYAEKKITPDLLDLEHLRATPTAQAPHRDCADLSQRACGRWIRFELNQDALAAINEGTGLWASGWNLSSVDHSASAGSVQEWLFVGGFIDLSPDNSFYPSYLGPKPRLILE